MNTNETGLRRPYVNGGWYYHLLLLWLSILLALKISSFQLFMLLLLTSPIIIYNFTAHILFHVDCEKLKFLTSVGWIDKRWGTGCVHCAGPVCVMWMCSNKSRSHVYSATCSPVYRISATILSLDLDVLLLHLSLCTVAIVVVIIIAVIVFCCCCHHHCCCCCLGYQCQNYTFFAHKFHTAMVEKLIVTLLPMEVSIFNEIQGLTTMVKRAFHLFLSCVK